MAIEPWRKGMPRTLRVHVALETEEREMLERAVIVCQN